LLDTEYHIYEDSEGSQLVRTPQYSLPKALHDHIDEIQPTNYLGNLAAMRNSFRISPEDIVPYHENPAMEHDLHLTKPYKAATVCNESAVTSLCLRTLYNTVNYTPQVPSINSVAMAAYLNETVNISDFHIFLPQQRKDANLDYTYNYTTVNNGINHQGLEPKGYFLARDTEANLDAQTVGGIVYPTQFTVHSTGGSPPFLADVHTTTDTNEPYLAWLECMLALEDPPRTITTS